MRFVALALIFSLSGLAHATAAPDGNGQFEQPEAVAWQKVAESLPLGSKIKVQTAQGKRLKGTLMRVDGTAIMLKRNTRIPEPALTVSFDDIARLERDESGGSVQIAKAVGVGLATGAGVFFSLVLIALQMD